MPLIIRITETFSFCTEYWPCTPVGLVYNCSFKSYCSPWNCLDLVISSFQGKWNLFNLLPDNAFRLVYVFSLLLPVNPEMAHNFLHSHESQLVWKGINSFFLPYSSEPKGLNKRYLFVGAIQTLSMNRYVGKNTVVYIFLTLSTNLYFTMLNVLNNTIRKTN